MESYSNSQPKNCVKYGEVQKVSAKKAQELKGRLMDMLLEDRDWLHKEIVIID